MAEVRRKRHAVDQPLHSAACLFCYNGQHDSSMIRTPDTGGKAIFVEESASPLSEHIHENLCAGSSSCGMEPSSKILKIESGIPQIRAKEASVDKVGQGRNDINIAESEYVLERKHKVFLNHSGVQKDFVEQLCVDLQRLDRYPFFDKLQSSLPIGEKFPELIFDAIKQCQLRVFILSKEFFTKTKWPMLELNAMVKEFEKPNSRIKIFPIFYHTSLNDWKDTKNCSLWMLQWEKWASDDKRINVEEWEKALNIVASIKGLVMREGISGVQFREEIVKVICELIPPETRWDDSHVQGRIRSCKVIRDKMDEISIHSRIGVVSLYGIGGIGKTTICKVLCNDLSSKFYDNVCHIDLGQTNEIKLLQKALKKLTTMSHDMLDKLNDVEEVTSKS